MNLKWLIGSVLAAFLAISAATAADSVSPLADAVKKNDHRATRNLLGQGASVNAPQVDGMTALHWAVYHDETEITKLVIAAGANVRAENRYGVMPLSLACRNGNSEIVEVLLGADADPNSSLRGGETVLMTAARTGRLGPVQALLARGADVNARERNQQTALMWAAAEGHVEVVDALITAGADIHTPLASGFKPVFFAVREGRADAVLRLLKAGVDVNDVMQPEKSSNRGPKAGTSPLILAVENGHFELADLLLTAGADPNDSRCGFTALHAITWVRKPIRGDGDPQPIGSGRLNSLDFVRSLIAHGANVNSRHAEKHTGSGFDRTEATPFVLAAETADISLMKLLLEMGADPSLSNKDGSTPLLAACGVGVLGNGDDSAGTEEDSIQAVGMLLELGADINAMDKNGNSAMHGAAYNSWTKLVQYIADHGANVNVWNQKNQRGWTPLLIAEGHRPGNFRPSPETVAAVLRAMHAAGVEPPAASPN